MSADRIPALVVSGFLGSGKTTLVRRLLEHAQRAGRRVAVVSNELGALGIDEALLGSGGQAYVELAGGCVCCKLSDELSETLQHLWDTVRPDEVIIETSGVALPFETQLNLWREPVSDWVGDDAAVVVVNAEQLVEGRDLDDTFEYQVSSADLLLLNKVDLVPEESLAEAEARLRALAPDTPILRCVGGDVAPELLFPPDPTGLRASRRGAGGPPRPHSHEQFEVEVLELEAGLSEEAVEARLRGTGALRIKGFVLCAEGLRLVQGVGRRLRLEVPSSDPPAEIVGRVVTIRRVEGERHHHVDHAPGG